MNQRVALPDGHTHNFAVACSCAKAPGSTEIYLRDTNWPRSRRGNARNRRRPAHATKPARYPLAGSLAPRFAFNDLSART